MKKLWAGIGLFGLACLGSGVSAQAQTQPKEIVRPLAAPVTTVADAQSKAQKFDAAVDGQAKLLARLKPDVRKTLEAAGRTVAAQLERPVKPNERARMPLDVARAVAKDNYAVLGSMTGGDIEALAFLVLMQAAKSAQDDLKAVMDQVKAINAAKDAGAKADDLSQMSQEDQQRMQRLMDRRSKMMELLSNMMKKISDTQSTIVSNMK